VLAVVVVMVLRRGNGNGQAKPAEGGTLYFQLEALSRDIRDLSQDLSRYQSAAELSARDRHERLMQGLEVMRDAIADHQQAVERRLPAA